MSTIKLNGTTSGSSIIKAPDSGSTNQTFTLPAATDTLAVNSDVTNKLPLAGGTMTGALNIQSAENSLAYFKSTDANANIKISDSNSSDINQVGIGAIGNNLTLIAGGDNRLSIDSTGAVTIPSQPAFSATKSGGNQTSTGVIVFNTVQTNIGSHYNSSTGKFTAPIAGQYYFSVFLMSSNNPSAFDVTFYKNNSMYPQFAPYFGDGPQYTQISGSAVVTLAANDYVHFQLQATGGGQVYGSGPSGKHSNFSGFLIG